MYNAYLHKLITCFLSHSVARDKVSRVLKFLISFAIHKVEEICMEYNYTFVRFCCQSFLILNIGNPDMHFNRACLFICFPYISSLGWGWLGCDSVSIYMQFVCINFVLSRFILICKEFIFFMHHLSYAGFYGCFYYQCAFYT